MVASFECITGLMVFSKFIGCSECQTKVTRGATSLLSVFEVTCSNTNFCFSDSPIAIRFTNQTVGELYETDKPIDGISKHEYRHTRYCWHSNVFLNIVSSRLFLNETSETHFYFDKDCAVGQIYLKSEIETKSGCCFAPSATANCSMGSHHFNVLPAMRRIQLELLDSLPSTNFARYRVRMTISDATDAAEFVVFDTVITKLTNICAANPSNQQVAVSQDLQDWDLPQCVHEIAGSTLTFQLSLSHFNISAIHQIFTVSRIFYYNQCPPQLNFEGRYDNPGDDTPAAGAVKRSHSHVLQSSPVNQGESDGNGDVA
ncbi:hypothetical protein IGI04_005370 [Brassica rapa subsp. trilocularis]|uniref:DUF223 domain-containing protein n=1 Tax=Brassica rapa subsp. trilocularis TaxID=1813537 RepID=A0ABQ7NDT6_BRACM|nr:hypothetical protein IGI04_005370 [Brassica rapa subsp. trilocularis]